MRRTLSFGAISRRWHAINRKLVTEPPSTFREACQWLLWHLLAARMFNGSGSVGRLDNFLLPFYRHDVAAGTLDDEEAVFHIACLLVRDTGYSQLGGYDRDGKDDSSPVSYLILEAIDRLRIPANIGVAVGKGIDPGLLTRGVEMQFANRNGIPKFLGLDRTAEGFARNGYPLDLGRQRVYSGCHWNAIPGREYTLNDIVKIHLGMIFDVALRDMMATEPQRASTSLLWSYFERHLSAASDTVAAALDFHMKHMGGRVPRAGDGPPVPRHHREGKDRGGRRRRVRQPLRGRHGARHGSRLLRGSGAAGRAGAPPRLAWHDAPPGHQLGGPGGERMRRLMSSSPRFGSGGSIADQWAKRLADSFTSHLSRHTPDGWQLIPGIFSWALVVAMGKELGPTPNGRREGEPISHGANPHPGFRQDGAATALAASVASVQPGMGNTAPLQMDLDPTVLGGADGPGSWRA